MNFMFEHWYEDEPANITRGELNRMGRTATYDPDEFFSAERYPLPMKCPECGKTMRPVHKHRLPDLPQYYFCTFCDAMIHESHPDIRFKERQTNADRIRQMSDEELAKWLWNLCCIEEPFECPALNHPTKNVDCKMIWLDWLKEEVK